MRANVYTVAAVKTRPSREEEPKVPLTGVRDEFRSALEAEIEAATRTAASGAVPLVNGRRLDGLASSFQYAFSAVSILNVPSDSPAELLIDGQEPLDAIVISVEGLAVTVSVQRDLGETVAAARLRSDMAFLLKRLIGRIEQTREFDNPAGERLLGAPANGEPAVIDDPLLTDSQDAALGSALGRDVTFIWGPPGTGKTQTIGAIGEQLYAAQRSVLLVSHTNAAVDQALLKIARALDGRFEHGQLLRLGIPSHPELAERDDLLLDSAVRERQRELAARQAELQAQRAELERLIADADRRLEIVEWSVGAESELAHLRESLAAVLRQEVEVAAREQRVAALAGDDESRRREQLREALGVVGATRDAVAITERRDASIVRAVQLRDGVAQAEQAVTDAERDLRTAHEIAPLIARERDLPNLEEHRASLEAAAARRSVAEAELAALGDELRGATELLTATQASNAIQRRLRRLPKPEQQASVVDDLRGRHAGVGARRDALSARVAEMAPVLAELEALDARLSAHRSLGSASQQEQGLQRAQAELRERVAEVHRVGREIDEAEQQLEDIERQAASFEHEHGASAPEVVARLDPELAELDALRAELRVAAATAARDRTTVNEAVGARCEQVIRLRLIRFRPKGGAENGIRALEIAQAEALAQSEAIDVTAVRAERAGHEEAAAAVDEELTAILSALAEIKREVIADAAVVATTLTRAYLWDEIQGRRFDTVILDEASMAPIPALWITAQLADANVVIVGDFRQLPPIKLADDPLADKWLGRDVFDASGVRDAYDAGAPPAHFVQLTEQFRMHPDISAIANTLIYDNTLHDAPSVATRTLGRWYRGDWGPDEPVTLVDTGSTNAWASSVVARGRPTRVNFLSAVICVDLAAKMLREDAEPPSDGSARILIATPYRGQARLLELLLRDAGLDALVRAGTAHTFQGSEAPIVIFDLVIDEPHWRVALMIPTYDETNSRLLNVALTRAEQRLVIVGDLEYIRKVGKRAFLGREFIPFLEQRYRTIDATELVSTGLAARAAHAQMLVAGSAVEPVDDREVMTGADALPRLLADLASATERIVIFSAFITENRLNHVLPHLQSATARGVAVYVFTKAPEDRGKSELAQYQRLESRLTDSGVTVIHKPRMHEKLVFVDTTIAWTGSMNVLSYRDTAEWMGRWDSAAVFADFATPVALEKVLAAYDANEARCPICDRLLVPAEGTDSIYWRCETLENSGERAGRSHYTQNLDKPIPRDGLIRCARADCDGSVEFRQGEKTLFWRCTTNPHHRQAYHPSHLRLPKMRELIEAAIGVRGLRKLADAAGIPKPDLNPADRDNGDTNGTQGVLFPPASQRPSPRRQNAPRLTPREISILQQLALHRSRGEIAEALGLQPASVKTYIRDLNRKFGTHDRAETVRAARAHGCI